MIYVRRPRLELGTVPLGGDRAVQLRQRRIAWWAAWFYRPVGNPGIEPGINRVSDGPRQPAGSLPAERKTEVSSPAPLAGRHRLSKPVAAPAAHLPLISARRAADSNRDAIRPSAF